jgi:hypothetical protein
LTPLQPCPYSIHRMRETIDVNTLDSLAATDYFHTTLAMHSRQCVRPLRIAGKALTGAMPNLNDQRRTPFPQRNQTSSNINSQACMIGEIELEFNGTRSWQR